MSAATKIMRLATGSLLVIIVIVAIFVLLRVWTPTWGATRAEVERTLPGDELIKRLPGDPTRAATIDVPPEAVWPWIAQIGDDRGGFYSYTFIENPLQKMAGGEAVYHNANRVLPEFQDPQPGEGMVMDSLQVYDVEPGTWLLAAETSGAGDFGWVWLWHVEPLGTNQSRLLVRQAMRLFPEASNPVMATVTNLGAFVMEWRMIQGLKLRAEGRTEAAAIEAVEILLWMAAFVAGLASAGLFLTRPAWQAPLLLGLAALFTLIWFTFWLPPVWLRLVSDVVLFSLLWWVARSTRRFPAGVRSERSAREGTVHELVEVR